MRRGRPPEGSKHVDRLDGPDESKQRLRTILDTLFGDLTVHEACERLNISEPRFHQLRRTALEGALEHLTPRPAGRPSATEVVEPSEVETLRRQVQDLRIDLQAARVRTELALTIPHVLRDGPTAKKNGAKAKAKRSVARKRRKGR